MIDWLGGRTGQEEGLFLQRSHKRVLGGSSGSMEGPGGRGAPGPLRARPKMWKEIEAERHQGQEDLAEGPAEEPLEGPGGSSQNMEGPGGRGAPRPWRAPRT